MSVMFKAKCSHSNVRCSDTDQDHGGIMPNQGSITDSSTMDNT